MSPAQAYSQAIDLAHQVRNEYGISGPCLKLSQLRAIYKDKGISLTYWQHKMKKLRGAYMNDDLGASVMVYKGLPNDPKIFTLAHELKHHLLDSEACSTVDNSSDVREIAAEVFAAELLLPENLFVQELENRGVTLQEQADIAAVQVAIIKMKRETGTTLSYQGLAKRAGRLKYADVGDLTATKWKVMEESLYGVPFYKRRQSVYVSF